MGVYFNYGDVTDNSLSIACGFFFLIAIHILRTKKIKFFGMRNIINILAFKSIFYKKQYPVFIY